MWRTLAKRDLLTLSPGDSLVYPVRFGRGLFDMSQGSTCPWEVYSSVGIGSRVDADRDDVLGNCFREPGEYGIRFELGIGELRPGWGLSRDTDLSLKRVWHGYLVTEPILIRIAKP